MDRFNLKLLNFEVRSCDDQLLDKEPHTTAEIVKWYEEDKCITIGIFESKKDEGWDVRLIGDRVIDEDFNILGQLTKFALLELKDASSEESAP